MCNIVSRRLASTDGIAVTANAALKSCDIAMCPLTSWGESYFNWQAVAKQEFCNTVEACRGLTNNALLIPIQK